MRHPPEDHITKLSTSGQAQGDVVVPWTQDLTLGDNGAAFSSDSLRVFSFNIDTGQTLWAYQVPDLDNQNIEILAATSGGGVAAKLTDYNTGLDTVINLDASGNRADVTSRAFPSTFSFSWQGEWSAFRPFGSAVSGLVMPVAVDPASLWPAPRGNPSQDGSDGALCDCLVELSEPEPPPPATICPICNLPAAATPATSCATFPGTGSTYVLLVGDPGLFPHYQGPHFSLSAQTQANTLQSQGHNVVACRVSSIQDAYYALTKNGTVDGGVYYFGHSGLRTVSVSGKIESLTSEIFIGDGIGLDTNISAQNVSYLRPIQTENGGGNFLGPNAAMWINGCDAGFTVFDTSYNGYVSIAQLLSVNLNRGVYAYNVGLYFSHVDAQHDPYTTGGGRRISDLLPMYMVPTGAPGHKPNPLACRPTGGYCSNQ